MFGIGEGDGEGWGWEMRTVVVGPGAPGEDLEEGEVGGVVGGGGAQGLDVGRLQQFGEDVGVWGGGRLRYEICGGAGGGGGFGEEDEGFEGVEGFLLGLVHGLGIGEG